MSSDPEDRLGPSEMARPVRTAWIAGAETFESFGRVLQPLAVGLVDEMVEVVVFSPTTSVGQGPGVGPREVVSYSPSRWWWPNGATVTALAEQLRGRKIELLHGLDGSVARLTHAVSRAARVGYLLSCYSLADAGRIGEAARSATALFAASEPIRRALVSRAACPSERVRLMRPGVYHVQQPTCLDAPDQRVAIIAGGPLDDFEALEAVLLCFSELAARKYDCVFFLIGSGQAERRLRRRAEELHLNRQLTFADCRPMGQLTGIFKAADVYLSPTSQERIDMPSLLAMAAGVPVLAAAGTGASDFLRDGQTAMFFSRGNGAELTVKLSSLLDDRPSARALAKSAIEYVHANHSPAVNVTALAHFYRQAVAGPAEPV